MTPARTCPCCAGKPAKPKPEEWHGAVSLWWGDGAGPRDPIDMSGLLVLPGSVEWPDEVLTAPDGTKIRLRSAGGKLVVSQRRTMGRWSCWDSDGILRTGGERDGVWTEDAESKARALAARAGMGRG